VESGFDNNNDGIDDVLLLDPFANDEGEAYLIQGPIVGEVVSYEARFDGPGTVYADYMNKAAPVGDLDGDVNGDGFADFWVTSSSERGGEYAGAVYLILGNGK
jgi:hypothetical protein